MTSTTSAAQPPASPASHSIFWKDPWSFLTHFVGAIAAAIGGGFLIHATPHDTAKLTVAITYIASLVLLLGASASYHFFSLQERGNLLLRRLDHSSIYLLIAGTYLAPLMAFLDGTWRTVMVSIIAGIGLAGVIFKVTWFHAPRWLDAALYLAMGWFVVIPGPKMFPLMTWDQIGWLAGGGLAYTFGAVIYATKKPDPWPKVFGFHEIWHLFVLAGAAGHFVFVWKVLQVPWP